MIDKEKLLELARFHKMKPWQEEKRYIQSLVLFALHEQPIVFKGGTYLWFFYGLDRFSEDLDFTAIRDIDKKIIENVKRTLELFGVENKIKLIRDTKISLSFRIAAKTPLTSDEKETCYVYVEISKREPIINKMITINFNEINYLIPTCIVNGLDIEELAAEKIRAIFTREVSRDIYDLYFLITKHNVKFKEELINKKLKYYNKTFSYNKFEQRINEKERVWKRELEPLIYNKPEEFDTVKERILNWSKE